MKIYSKSYFILLFLIFSQVNISALTLDEAVKNALNYNYLIISKKYELQSANYKLKAAKSLQMPSFFFNQHIPILTMTNLYLFPLH